MARMNRRPPVVQEKRFPEVQTILLAELRASYSSQRFGKNLAIFIDLLTPPVAESHRFLVELRMFFEKHRVSLPMDFLDANGGIVVFDDQQRGMDFAEDWPSRMGSIQMFRDGTLISEKRALSLDKK